MNKGWKGNYLEDFVVGDSWRCPVPRAVTSGDTAAYIALTGDRTPMYCGADGWLHPLVTFHAVFGQTVRQISLNAVANLGYAELVWGVPAREGDTLTTTLEVTGVKENSSGKNGIVWVRTVGRNQHGDEVLSFSRWVMIRKRDPGTATAFLDAPVTPSLPSSVSPSSLHIEPGLVPHPAATGGRWVFDDYAAGERIYHYDGMTVNPSDHMALTRLFQNSAKVHFDGVAMDGRPLVYGGVVISHCYAISYNGLENRVGIAAINAGTHANPCYAGDTLYCLTEVVEKAAINDEVGALRLRMVGVKNEDPSAAEGFSVMVDDPRKPGRQRHASNVVLDLDYWEIIRR